MSSFDVSIIGASVIGGVAARECAKKGLNVALIEEDNKVGKDHRCTALYSVSGLESTHINYQSAILNKINGAKIYSQNNCLTVRTKNTIAYVLDRQKFDELSIKQAVAEGAELFLGNQIIGFNGGPFSKDKAFVSKVIVGTDGARSFTAQHFKFPQIKDFVYCYETELTDIQIDTQDLVDVFIDNKMFPGFFGWIVPTSRRSARFGFGVNDPQSLPKVKESFFAKKEIKDSIENGHKSREFFAPIPISQRPQTQKGNVLLVGDAAGQVKATTGGGVVFGAMCATVAARSISDHLLKNKRLNYEYEWRTKYGHVLTAHSSLRILMNNLDCNLTDFSISVAGTLGFNRFLENFGDMDFVLKPLAVKA